MSNSKRDQHQKPLKPWTQDSPCDMPYFFTLAIRPTSPVQLSEDKMSHFAFAVLSTIELDLAIAGHEEITIVKVFPIGTHHRTMKAETQCIMQAARDTFPRCVLRYSGIQRARYKEVKIEMINNRDPGDDQDYNFGIPQ